MRFVIVISIVFSVIVITDIALASSDLDSEETFPTIFKSEQEALKQNCKIVFLKGKNRKSCLMQKFVMKVFKIAIYDQNSKGEFVKSEELCIPSWYNKATIEVQDFLGNGQQFMLIKFEGGTGTGVLQMILMIIGWRNDKYVPVLLETISFNSEQLEHKRKLEVQYGFEKIKTSRVTLNLAYKYFTSNGDKSPYNVKTAWTESLTWNCKNYSFYNEQYEHNMKDSEPSFIRRNIAKVRLSLKNVKIPKSCDEEETYKEIFEKTRVKEIMSENFSPMK